MKHDFKPFDRVLVRDDSDEPWRCQVYSHRSGKLHACILGVYAQCIPYEGNENLLGMTDSPEPEFKKGDIVAVWDGDDPAVKYVRVYSHYQFGGHYVISNTHTMDTWEHCEKFDPASVKEE